MATRFSVPSRSSRNRMTFPCYHRAGWLSTMAQQPSERARQVGVLRAGRAVSDHTGRFWACLEDRPCNSVQHQNQLAKVYDFITY